ncbi:hypothetical protein BPORC_1800 [Bifidobacterium porcinum]|nr:hypothetical protein BPORC_1800 [Bifidobacterium porcinum]
MNSTLNSGAGHISTSKFEWNPPPAVPTSNVPAVPAPCCPMRCCVTYSYVQELRTALTDGQDSWLKTGCLEPFFGVLLMHIAIRLTNSSTNPSLVSGLQCADAASMGGYTYEQSWKKGLRHDGKRTR